MPEKLVLLRKREFSVLQEFLVGIENKVLVAQVTMFILLAMESESEAEVRVVLVKFLRWLSGFAQKNAGLESEIGILVEKLRLECLVFRIPFFWPDYKFYRAKGRSSTSMIM